MAGLLPPHLPKSLHVGLLFCVGRTLQVTGCAPQPGPCSSISAVPGEGRGASVPFGTGHQGLSQGQHRQCAKHIKLTRVLNASAFRAGQWGGGCTSAYPAFVRMVGPTGGTQISPGYPSPIPGYPESVALGLGSYCLQFTAGEMEGLVCLNLSARPTYTALVQRAFLWPLRGTGRIDSNPIPHHPALGRALTPRTQLPNTP